MTLVHLLWKMYADQNLRVNDTRTGVTVTANVETIINDHPELLDGNVDAIHFSRTFNEVMIDLD